MKAIDRLKEVAWADTKKRNPLMAANAPHSLVISTYKPNSTNGLTKCIVHWFLLNGHFAERTNTMGVYREGETIVDVVGFTRKMKGSYTKGTGTKGSSDIKAMAMGRSIMIEIKFGKDRMSPAQKSYKDRIIAAGGIYLVAKTFDQFMDDYDYIISTMSTESGTTSFARERYRLAPTCPCGKSNKDGKFNPFKDDPTAGQCHSCGELFLSKQKPPEPRPEKKQVDQKFIPMDLIIKTMQCYDKNNFCTWLINTIGMTKAYGALKKFYIGTTKDGSVLFPQIDKQLRVLNAKKVRYGIDGHRSQTFGALSHLYKLEQGYHTGLFGGHQTEPGKIILVESEKTAMVGHATYGKGVWMATGGSNGLTNKKASVLMGRDILILPDCDEAGRNGAVKTSKVLAGYGCTVTIHDIDPSRADGTDICDMIVKYGITPILEI